MGILSEILMPWDAILFTIVTYSPTFYFTAQLVVRTIQGVRPTDTLHEFRIARNLTILWVLNAFIHVGLWWIARPDVSPEILLLPIIPGSQVILMMVFVLAHYRVEIYMSDRDQGHNIPRDVEESPPSNVETTVPLAAAEAIVSDNGPARSGEDTPQIIAADSESSTFLYRPPIFLLLLSIILCSVTMLWENRDSSSTLIGFLWIQAYIPSILLHTYLIIQIMRKALPSLKNATTIAGLSYDLVPLWLGGRLLVLYANYTSDGLVVPLVHALPGGAEILLVTYLAVQYTRSVYAESKRQVVLGVLENENVLPEPTDDPTSQATIDLQETSIYHPSIITLLVSIALTLACAYIEFRAEPICGITMSLIVYAPTIIAHTHILWIRYRNLHSTVETITKQSEWAMQLAIIWVITYAFYVFVWPVSLYMNPEVMNPWIRSPEVALIVYIAARYARDTNARQLASVGTIRLPPDASEADSTTVQPPALQTP